MYELLQARQWTVAEAIARLCFGDLATSDSDDLVNLIADIGEWIQPGSESDLSDIEVGDCKRANVFADACRRLFSKSLPKHMHPAIWIWLACSHAKSSRHPRFLYEFESWMMRLQVTNRCPVLQYRPADRVRWQGLALNCEQPNIESGRLFFAVLLQKFDAATVSSGEWRLVIKTSESLKVAGAHRIAGSAGCEELVRAAMEQYSKIKGSPVALLAKPAPGGQMYECSGLRREALILEVLATKKGKKISKYSESTYVRAFSMVVLCQKGRPRKV